MAKLDLQRATPESQGISSEQVEKLLLALNDSKRLHMHSIMLLRNGKVIGETGFYPYQKELWHMGYSMSKSVTSMAIGFLIAEGILTLDTKIVDIFKKNVGLRGLLRQKDLTIWHLLTMTSGVGLNEVGAVAGDDWVKCFLEAPVHHDPGEEFEYNSMNSYMLSAVVTELTGETLIDYLTPRLFQPLGITRVFWESCPKGINKGGWGLFLSVEDFAKLGQLYLDGGSFKGQQILPREWVLESTKIQAVPPKETGFAGYGYQMWIGKREGSFAFNGMLGQNVLVYPDIQTVVVSTAGNDVFFHNDELEKLLAKYLPEFKAVCTPLAENPSAYRSLLRVQKALSALEKEPVLILRGGWGRVQKQKKDWKEHAKELSGRHFRLEAAYVGLFPLVGQVLHNNYTAGIAEVGFSLKDDRFYLEILEGEDTRFLPVGFEKAEVTDLCFSGEYYRAAVEGSFAYNEDGRKVLTVTVSFLEEALKRRIKFFLKDDGMEVHFSETPGKDIILDGMGFVMAEVMDHPLIRRVTEKNNANLVKIIVSQTLEPTLEAEEI